MEKKETENKDIDQDIFERTVRRILSVKYKPKKKEKKKEKK